MFIFMKSNLQILTVLQPCEQSKKDPESYSKTPDDSLPTGCHLGHRQLCPGSWLTNLSLSTSLQSLSLYRFTPSWCCQRSHKLEMWARTPSSRTSLVFHYKPQQNPPAQPPDSPLSHLLLPWLRHRLTYASIKCYLHSPRTFCASCSSVPVHAKCLLPWPFLFKQHSFCLVFSVLHAPGLCWAFSNDLPSYLY